MTMLCGNELMDGLFIRRAPHILLRVVILFNILSVLGIFSVQSKGYDDLATSPLTGYACEGSTLTITCSHGLRIKVLRSNYGRFSRQFCNEGLDTEKWDLECMSTKSLHIVFDTCNNQTKCSVPATNIVFGDTCSSTFKYLEVEYVCVEDVTSPHTTYPPETSKSSTSLASSVNGSHDASGNKQTTRSGISIDTSVAAEQDMIAEFKTGSFCEAVLSRNVLWPRSRPGQVVTMKCPNNNAVRKAVWQCGDIEPVNWINRPDLSHCISPQVISILELVKESHVRKSDGLVELIVSDLVVNTNKAEQLFGGDLLSVAKAMKEVVAYVDDEMHRVSRVKNVSRLVHKINQAILETNNNLLDSSQIDSWYDIPPSERPSLASDIVSIIERCAFQQAYVTTEPGTILNIASNIVLEVHVINVTIDDGVSRELSFPSLQSLEEHGDTGWMSEGCSITLTGKTIRELGVNGISKVAFALFNNIEKWLSNEFPPDLDLHHSDGLDPDTFNSRGRGLDEDVKEDRSSLRNLENKTVNTKIISASIFNWTVHSDVQLTEPVIFVMKHLHLPDEYTSDPNCSFWVHSERTTRGHWSTDGCRLLETNLTHTKCSCEHLTNFAVLMSVNEQNLTAVQKFSLSFLTYFGCILSIVCLVFAFVTFQFFKNLQCDRNTIHKNLVLTLCIAEIMFLIGIVQYERPVLCAVMAGLLHYLFLVTFFWMCIEGVQLYVMLVEVFEAEKSRVKWYYVIAYGMPAVIVLISVIAGAGNYGTDFHCWLSVEKGFIWAFVGPVCLILFVNIIMLTIAMYVMCTHDANAVNAWKTRPKSIFQNIRSWVKGAFVLVILLGLTWTFGLFHVNEQSVALAYIFTILNSFQGIFIFVFYCLMNEKVRKEYRRWVRHTSWIPERLRVHCGDGVKSSASMSPIHSSSAGMSNQKMLSLEFLAKLFTKNRRGKRASTTTLPTSCNNPKLVSNPTLRNNNNNFGHPTFDSSRVVCFHDNESSQVYSEATEDPYAYLESARMELYPDEECYLPTGDMSMMEGSVADTDYMEDYGRRTSSMIDVNKYKITGGAVDAGFSDVPQNRMSSRPDYEFFRKADLHRMIAAKENGEKSFVETGTGTGTNRPVACGDHPMSYVNLGSTGCSSVCSLAERKPIAPTRKSKIRNEI